MKQEFEKSDKLEAFRKALNYEAKLYCNVDEAYDTEKAANFLQQLAKSWKMDEDSVTAITIMRVQNTLDKQSRMYVLRFIDMMNIPHSAEEIRERWETLSASEKDTVIDGIISYCEALKKQGSGGGTESDAGTAT